MHGTRTPLTLWFWAAYLVATHTPGISALQLQRQLAIGVARVLQVAARGGQHLRAVPDEDQEHDCDQDIKRGDQQDAQPDRQRAQPLEGASRDSWLRGFDGG